MCDSSSGAQASVAILDRKMATLTAEISQQAAVAAQKHKFNQGSAHPTGDASPRRLASGLAATAQVSALLYLHSKHCMLCPDRAWSDEACKRSALNRTPALNESCVSGFRLLYEFRKQPKFGVFL